MANVNILGAIGVDGSDYQKIHTFGQEVVYDALMQILGDHNDDKASVIPLFVEGDTWKFQDIYKLPGQGRMQRRASQTRAGEIHATGEWTVGFPLEDFGANVAMSDIDWGYMDVREFNRYVQTIINQNWNTHRDEILKALFNNTARPFKDLGGHFPDTTVQPLANGDSVLYPAAVGSELNSAANNYLGVAASAIAFTNTNNPIPAMVEALRSRFGTPTSGSDIVVFMNNAQTPFAQGLAGFNLVPNRFVTLGNNISYVQVAGIPLSVGTALGESDGALLCEWRWLPPGYMLGIHFGAPRPLKLRTDPPDTPFTTGLQLIAEDMNNPFMKYQWRDRFGYGCGNRLNGVAMDLTAAGGANTYTIPAKWVA